MIITLSLSKGTELGLFSALAFSIYISGVKFLWAPIRFFLSEIPVYLHHQLGCFSHQKDSLGLSVGFFTVEA
jgi:hypothetical protein